jgi:hypothetical protein
MEFFQMVLDNIKKGQNQFGVDSYEEKKVE